MKKTLKLLTIICVLLLAIFSVVGCDNKKDVKDIEKEVEKSINKGEYTLVIGTNVTNGDAGLKYAYLEKYDAYAVCGLGNHNGVVVSIPEKVNGKPVIAIAKRAFAGNMQLQAVSIPDTVQVILSGAFEECPFLQQVTIGSKDSDLKYIQNIIFSQTSVSSFTYKGTMSEWKNMLRDHCGDYLTTWAYNSNVPTMSVICNDGTLKYWSNTGGLIEEETFANASKGLIFSLNPDGDYTVAGIGSCTDTDIVIPSTYNGKPVTSIGDSAFYYDSLTSVTIPDNVTSIGEQAFLGCKSLTSITIPDSVTSIGDSAFAGCTSLTSVTIPDSITSIADSTFDCCTSLRSITIPDGVTRIGQGAFNHCTSLTSVTISDSVTSIRDWAFYYCTSLRSITIPDSVTSIGKSAFSCCALESVIISRGVTNISAEAFSGCSSLASVSIPDSVTNISAGAFLGCSSLASVSIPDSVTSIDAYAFSNCKSLTNINIPDSVTSIDVCAFQHCTSLTSVIIPGSVTSIGGYAFSGCTSLTIYCEATSKPSGWDSEWNNFGYSYSTVPAVWGCSGN